MSHHLGGLPYQMNQLKYGVGHDVIVMVIRSIGSGIIVRQALNRVHVYDMMPSL